MWQWIVNENLDTCLFSIIDIVFILEWKFGVKEEAEAEEPSEDEIKFDISGAMAEEEGADEEEAFECPACGKEFTEMVSECPECGAEFEGLDEDEEGEDEEEEEEEEEEGDEDG